MIKRRRFPKVFFGWWTVLAGGVNGFWGTGYYLYGFSALFKPISSELGFSRAVTSVAASIGRFEGGLESLVIGWLTDRFGPRRIILFGVSLLGLGLILMNFVNSLWAFYLVWGAIIGTGFNAYSGLPMATAITNWFVKKRGLATGIRVMVSGVFLLPFVTWLITTQGWRMACVIGGVVMLVVGLPLTWFFVRDQRPEYYGLLPDGATMDEELKEDTGRMLDRGAEYAAEVEEVEFTLRQAMRTPTYWLLLVAHIGPSITMTSLLVHFIPLLTDMGLSPAEAAATVALSGLTGAVSRFVSGFLADRFKKQHLRFVLGGAYLLQASGIALFVLSPTMAMVYPFLILYFFCWAVNMILTTLITGRYFGRKAFGSISGFSRMFLTPIEVAAPVYIGWVYDATGSYATA
ncbi:MFS transporter, partial [Chloroflexota bacterium]